MQRENHRGRAQQPTMLGSGRPTAFSASPPAAGFLKAFGMMLIGVFLGFLLLPPVVRGQPNCRVAIYDAGARLGMASALARWGPHDPANANSIISEINASIANMRLANRVCVGWPYFGPPWPTVNTVEARFLSKARRLRRPPYPVYWDQFAVFLSDVYADVADKLSYQMTGQTGQREWMTTCGNLYYRMGYLVAFAEISFGLASSGAAIADAEVTGHIQRTIQLVDKARELKTASGSCLKLPRFKQTLQEILRKGDRSRAAATRARNIGRIELWSGAPRTGQRPGTGETRPPGLFPADNSIPDFDDYLESLEGRDEPGGGIETAADCGDLEEDCKDECKKIRETAKPLGYKAVDVFTCDAHICDYAFSQKFCDIPGYWACATEVIDEYHQCLRTCLDTYKALRQRQGGAETREKRQLRAKCRTPCKDAWHQGIYELCRPRACDRYCRDRGYPGGEWVKHDRGRRDFCRCRSAP